MIKKIKKKTPVSKHMQELSSRYNPRTKILRTQKGETLKKYAHGYFDIYKYNKSKLTPAVQKFLNSYPKWYLRQFQANQDDFKFIFQIMVEAHPKTLRLVEQENSHVNIYKIIEHVRFPYLKQLEISFENTFNIQAIAWLQAPVLQDIKIQSKGALSSINPLAKCNLKGLKTINLRKPLSWIDNCSRNYDLTKVSRIRMFQASKLEFMFEYCSISMFRDDMSDMATLSKVQLEKLPNFKVAQYQSKKGDNPINTKKICQSLNKKFFNQTIYQNTEFNALFPYFRDIYESQPSSSGGDNESYYGAQSYDEERWIFGRHGSDDYDYDYYGDNWDDY